MSKTRVAGWVISALVAAMLIGPSAGGKFVDFDGKEEMFGKLGWTTELMFKIGVVEVACALIYLVPRTSFLGAILLTGYLGGATAAHVRIGDPFFMPIVVGVAAWVGLGLRVPAVRRLAFGIEAPETPPPMA